jgi:hypothetical protein
MLLNDFTVIKLIPLLTPLLIDIIYNALNYIQEYELDRTKNFS